MKKTKSILLIVGISAFVLIGLGLLIYFGVLNMIFNVQTGTGYNSISVTKDQVILTNLNAGLFTRTGFRANHHLTDEYDNNQNKYFMYGADNKPFFTFYLQANGIDSSRFNADGFKPLVCVFTPKDITQNPPLYKSELESLGFGYWFKEEGHQISICGSNCPICGNCAGCLVGYGCSGTTNRCCDANGFYKYVKTGENACWMGDYKPAILNEMSSRMICNVKGQGYDIPGTVGVTSTGFYCAIDPSKYPFDYMTIPINPSVEFRLAKQIIYYRFENNLCSQVSILENQKTANDYLTQSECQRNIIVPITEPVPPQPSGFSKFIDSIVNFFKNLFRWI